MRPEIWRRRRRTTPRFGLKMPTRCDARNDAPLCARAGSIPMSRASRLCRNSAPRETIVPRRIPSPGGSRAHSGKSTRKFQRVSPSFRARHAHSQSGGTRVHIVHQVFAHDTKRVARQGVVRARTQNRRVFADANADHWHKASLFARARAHGRVEEGYGTVAIIEEDVLTRDLAEGNDGLQLLYKNMASLRQAMKQEPQWQTVRAGYRTMFIDRPWESRSKLGEGEACPRPCLCDRVNDFTCIMRAGVRYAFQRFLPRPQRVDATNHRRHLQRLHRGLRGDG